MKIMIINGPNLNLLGKREPEIYGTKTYKDLVSYLKINLRARKIKSKIIQTNSEGLIIDALHYAYKKKYDGVVINPGAYTHYSYAILDAITSIQLPTIEVHISDINNREEFRKTSVIRSACYASIIGKNFEGYVEAIDCLINLFTKKTK